MSGWLLASTRTDELHRPLETTLNRLPELLPEPQGVCAQQGGCLKKETTCQVKTQEFV